MQISKILSAVYGNYIKAGTAVVSFLALCLFMVPPYRCHIASTEEVEDMSSDLLWPLGPAAVTALLLSHRCCPPLPPTLLLIIWLASSSDCNRFFDCVVSGSDVRKSVVSNSLRMPELIAFDHYYSANHFGFYSQGCASCIIVLEGVKVGAFAIRMEAAAEQQQ